MVYSLTVLCVTQSDIVDADGLARLQFHHDAAQLFTLQATQNILQPPSST